MAGSAAARRSRSSPATQLPLDLQADDEEEHRHQPVVDPVVEVLGEPVGADLRPGSRCARAPPSRRPRRVRPDQRRPPSPQAARCRRRPRRARNCCTGRADAVEHEGRPARTRPGNTRRRWARGRSRRAPGTAEVGSPTRLPGAPAREPRTAPRSARTPRRSPRGTTVEGPAVATMVGRCPPPQVDARLAGLRTTGRRLPARRPRPPASDRRSRRRACRPQEPLRTTGDGSVDVGQARRRRERRAGPATSARERRPARSVGRLWPVA